MHLLIFHLFVLADILLLFAVVMGLISISRFIILIIDDEERPVLGVGQGG